jgi:hypothetical protein
MWLSNARWIFARFASGSARKQVLDVNPLDHEHAVLELDLAGRLSDQSALIRANLTRLQRASEGAGESAARGGDDVVERGRVLTAGRRVDPVVLGDRTVKTEADRFRLARQVGIPERVADALDSHA